MKITMLCRDIWLGGQTNTAYREGKSYDVPEERRDHFVARGSAVDADGRKPLAEVHEAAARGDSGALGELPKVAADHLAASRAAFGEAYRGDPVDDAPPAGK